MAMAMEVLKNAVAIVMAVVKYIAHRRRLLYQRTSFRMNLFSR